MEISNSEAQLIIHLYYQLYGIKPGMREMMKIHKQRQSNFNNQLDDVELKPPLNKRKTTY